MSLTSYPAGYAIGSRYLVQRTIGSGEDSLVYEALDSSLQRSVAVRSLHYGVLSDPQWREYVRHETTAVAALHHPNLVRIYDWGEDDGVPYVVSEYLAGGSLADVLRARGRLSLEQTSLIGLEVATALAYAHARGFVHGALRPSKILFDSEGRVRVNDFGLAATLANTPGAARSLDDAHYLTPEHVVGMALEGRSDIYALSLILFECLTGHVPFTGTSMESIRSARLGAALPSRPELGPFDLLLALGAAPDVTARPDAELFASRLASIATTLPVPRPVTLGSERGGGFVVPSAHDVLSVPAVAITGRTPSVDGTGEPVVRPFDLPGYRESVEAAHRAGTPDTQRSKRGLLGLLVIIALLVTIITLGVSWKVGAFTASYKVPNLVGLSPHDASLLVASDKFSIEESSHTGNSTSITAGEILTQAPATGALLKRGGVIHVVLSAGPTLVTVPGVLSLGCKTAKSHLESVGLTATCPPDKDVSDVAKIGSVVEVFYGMMENPLTVPEGSALVLALSSGPPNTTTTTSSTTTTTTTMPSHANVMVPNLVGQSRAETETLMHEAQLYYVTYGPGSATETWTKVVSTDPVAGTFVPWHSSVKVYVQ